MVLPQVPDFPSLGILSVSSPGLKVGGQRTEEVSEIMCLFLILFNLFQIQDAPDVYLFRFLKLLVLLHQSGGQRSCGPNMLRRQRRKDK